jgi:hypothetical protein
MPEIQAKVFIDKVLEEHIKEKLTNPINTIRTIPFRNWLTEEARKVFRIPTEYCLFRKNNGRISTKINTYETTKAELVSDDEKTQKIIFDFLGREDPTENRALKSLLKKNGQKDPVIITADGFVIDGNRRLWALKTLNEEYPGKFEYINVVVLPGTDEDPPTHQEICRLELRHQNQKTGKSEYTGINKAIQNRRYIREINLTLTEILKDDPFYSDLPDKKFESAKKKFEIDNFGTLDLVDKYLKSRNQEGDYESVEDRWLSFQELNQRIISKFEDTNFTNKYRIQDHDKGLIQAAAFNFIQLKRTGDLVPKNVNLIRDITDWITTDKKEFLKIGKIEDENTTGDPIEKDAEWQELQGEEIKAQVKKLQNLARKDELAAGPVYRLEEALRNLEHKELDIRNYKTIPIKVLEKSFELTRDIENINNGLKSYFYNEIKNVNTNKNSEVFTKKKK